MVAIEELRERLETMLGQHLGLDHLVTDDEGDYPVRAGSAKYYVRLSAGDPAVVHIYAHVLVGVAASAELYTTLNAVNSHTDFGRFFHQGDAVLLSHELLADTLDAGELAGVCRAVADLADHYDDLFKAEFGGRINADDADGGPENHPQPTAKSPTSAA